jgi:hypothetical protein
MPQVFIAFLAPTWLARGFILWSLVAPRSESRQSHRGEGHLLSSDVFGVKLV